MVVHGSTTGAAVGLQQVLAREEAVRRVDAGTELHQAWRAQQHVEGAARVVIQDHAGLVEAAASKLQRQPVLEAVLAARACDTADLMASVSAPLSANTKPMRRPMRVTPVLAFACAR